MLTVTLFTVRRLDVIVLGDDVARGLGMNVQALRAPPREARTRPGTRRAVRRRTPPGGVGSPVPVVVLAALRVFAPGGVELVMSPQLALCEVSSHESNSGGFCRAELALRSISPEPAVQSQGSTRWCGREWVRGGARGGRSGDNVATFMFP